MAYNRQTTFAGGEVAPTLYARTDLAKYNNSLRQCRNFIVTQHGAATNRSGTQFVHEVKNSTKKVRLIPFIFNNDQTFVMEFGEHYIRLYQNGGIVVGPATTFFNGITTTINPGDPIEISSPYLAADLPYLKFAQIGDVVTLVCVNRIAIRDYAPLELKRFSNTDWRLVPLLITRPSAPNVGDLVFLKDITDPQYNTGTWIQSFTYQGGYLINHTNPSGGTPLHNYRSLQDNNVGNLPKDNIGSWWSDEGVFTGEPTLNHLDTPSRPAKFWQWVITSVDQNGIESLPSTAFTAFVDFFNLNCNAKISLFTDRTVRFTWDVVANTKFYNIYRGKSGVFGFVGQATFNVYTDSGETPDYTHTPPTGNNPFPGSLFYPGSVAFFQQRRWFGATITDPQTIWGSKVGDFYNFDSSLIPVDDDSVKFTIASRQAETIRNLLGLRVLLTMTSGGEWSVQGGSGTAITPSNVQALPQSYRGSAYLDPLSVGNVALFVQGMNNLVRELIFNLYSDTYDGNDLTVMSTHLFQNHNLVDWTYASVPFSVIWAVREDGVLLGCTYLREHELVAWHRHDSLGLFENVCAIPENVVGGVGKENAVYVVVNRTINGATKRYVERFSTRLSIPRLQDGTIDTTKGVFLDASLIYNGAPATVFSGLGHLEAASVKVLADGNVLGPYTVTSGQINISADLPDGASYVIAGLSYTSDLETLDLRVAGAEIRSEVKSENRVAIEVVDSRGLQIGRDFNNLKEWKQRQVSDSFNPVAAFTGLDHIRFPARYEHDARAVARQSDPLPVTIIALTREFDVGGH